MRWGSLEGPEPKLRQMGRWGGTKGSTKDQIVQEKTSENQWRFFRSGGDVLCETEFYRWWVLDQLKHASMMLIMQP